MWEKNSLSYQLYYLNLKKKPTLSWSDVWGLLCPGWPHPVDCLKNQTLLLIPVWHGNKRRTVLGTMNSLQNNWVSHSVASLGPQHWLKQAEAWHELTMGQAAKPPVGWTAAVEKDAGWWEGTPSSGGVATPLTRENPRYILVLPPALPSWGAPGTRFTVTPQSISFPFRTPHRGSMLLGPSWLDHTVKVWCCRPSWNSGVDPNANAHEVGLNKKQAFIVAKNKYKYKQQHNLGEN